MGTEKAKSNLLGIWKSTDGYKLNFISDTQVELELIDDTVDPSQTLYYFLGPEDASEELQQFRGKFIISFIVGGGDYFYQVPYIVSKMYKNRIELKTCDSPLDEQCELRVIWSRE